MVIRLALTKEDPVRYIAHLDYAKAIQLAIRRAGLPAAYSSGFNPHMKLSFASALPLGTTASVEYADLELTEDWLVSKVVDALQNNLPRGIQVKAAKEIVDKVPSMSAIIDTAIYTLTEDEPLLDVASVQKALALFNSDREIVYCRVRPVKNKKRRPGRGREQTTSKELLVHNYLKEPLIYNENKQRFYLVLKQSPQGGIKPLEVLTALRDKYLPQLDIDNLLVNREAILANGLDLLAVLVN